MHVLDLAQGGSEWYYPAGLQLKGRVQHPEASYAIFLLDWRISLNQIFVYEL